MLRRDIINKMNRIELLDLLWSYNEYIQEANEENYYGNGWRPVNICEYWENDYPLRKEIDT